jgi:glutamyl-tRNA synthetase
MTSSPTSSGSRPVRTRFAPSPTGFIHLGNIRSALYPWAFARASEGTFVLRIEDTDVERSSQAAVDVILDSMQWLGLDHDEGPFYQMQRMDRYKEVLAQMQAQGLVYPCYMSVAELDALRERQMASKEKPRYDGTWRPEAGKLLPPVPEGVKPVLRFRTPQGGSVVWEDKVKGRIEISNDELDDLVIARPDGTPTYNFCVVVDDIDMAITHVIRGDDHVNNTPRQINIFRALGKEPPVYAHLPTVLNEQGEKMSKRNGAKPVTQYRDEGYLPDAMVNYLARLGWSHGDDEIFSREQLLQWFNLDHLGRSAAQFDEAKLRWVNAQHLKPWQRWCWRPWWPSSCSALDIGRRQRWPMAACPHLRPVQGPVLDTTVELAALGACFMARFSLRQAELAAACDRRHCAGSALRWPMRCAACEWDKAAISRGVQAGAGGARAEDASTGHACGF